MPSVNSVLPKFILRFIYGALWVLVVMTQNAQAFESEYWQKIVAHGQEQEVYFHAWGGDPQINGYIQWVATQVQDQYGINLVHVKLSDTSEAVSRVVAEKSAMPDSHNLKHKQKNGSVDLIWINGANFATMQHHGLLQANWASKLPNFALTDPDNNPAVHTDFGLPTNGMESPWGQASLTFYYDREALDRLNSGAPPYTLQELLDWSTAHPGRFSYPMPTDFLGMSFLKYALIVLHQSSAIEVRELLQQAPNQETSQTILAPLWQYLDVLHPTLWRNGQHFMQSGAQLRRLVDDTELSLAFTFSAPEIPAAVNRFDLPPTIRSYAMRDGSLTNIHFVAIPFNAAHSEAAQLVANFLLSPIAQARKQHAKYWGDKSVLMQSSLTPEQKALFRVDNAHPSALPHNAMIRPLCEPHPSWVQAILAGWQYRYGVSP